MHNFVCQTVLNIFKYILFIKSIETSWSRDVIDIRVLAHFKFWVKNSQILYVLNCFKYFKVHILEQMSQKQVRQEKIWTTSKWLDIHKDLKCQND